MTGELRILLAFAGSPSGTIRQEFGFPGNSLSPPRGDSGPTVGEERWRGEPGAFRSLILPNRPSIEVVVITSQDAIGQLADRIERAYHRRFPGWSSAGLTPGVWESAASRLSESGDVEPAIPIDPELFVAVQVARDGLRDPWAELTQQQALRCYLRAVRRIVGQLREELRREVRLAEGRLLRGVTLDQLLATKAARISPLTFYILAHRAGRLDLSLMIRREAAGQDRSCPLYRLASRSFLPSHAYPQEPAMATAHDDNQIIAFSVN